MRADLTLKPPDDSMMTTSAPAGPAIINLDFSASQRFIDRRPRPFAPPHLTARLLHTIADLSRELEL